MKKALIAIAIAAFAQTASAVVEDSAHDLGPGNTDYTGGTQSSCMYCHAPHHSAGISAAPLWNRNMSAQTFTQTMADASSHNVTGGASLTCLACHDGTMDLGTTLNTSDTLTPNRIVSEFQIGAAANLNADHPVSVTYTAGGTTDGATLRTAAAAANLLGIDVANLATVECSSCHDPHLGEAGVVKFLRTDLVDMCGACHMK